MKIRWTITSNAIYPNAGRGHRLSKAEFYSIRAQMFAVHRPHSFNDATDVGVLAEGIAGHRALFLNIYFLQDTKNKVYTSLSILMTHCINSFFGDYCIIANLIDPSEGNPVYSWTLT